MNASGRPLQSHCKVTMTSVVLLFKTLQISIDVYQLLMYTQCLLCNKSPINVSITLVAWYQNQCFQ